MGALDSELRRCLRSSDGPASFVQSIFYAAALRVDERTVYRWWSVYRKQGWEGLTVKSRRAHHYQRTPVETVALVLELRCNKHWGPDKIEGYLRNYKTGVKPVSHRTVHKILVQARLDSPITHPRRVWGKHRFVRFYSNSLWQADYKLTRNDEWMISYLDDHSRFIPGSRIHHNPTA